MIPEEELAEIKNYLEKSENPLFFFDDDNDGLCSFVLFRQFAGKGDYVPIKTHPALDVSLLNKVEEFRPDYIFVLDKPIITQDFIDGAKVPIIWLDHHPLVKIERVKYYNPKKYDKTDVSSTTYWAYEAVNGKLWIAVVGAVSDWTIPDYFEEFEKKYPDLINGKKTPPELLYNSKLGELCRIMSFLTKGKPSSVTRRIKAILKIEEPYEILEKKTKEGNFLFEESEKIYKTYRELLERAMKMKIEDGMLIFTYTRSETSMTSELSNELLYRHPGKVILVGREHNGEMKMSLRSDGLFIDKLLEDALIGLDGYGGGHRHAVGANVKVEDFPKFVERIKREISKE